MFVDIALFSPESCLFNKICIAEFELEPLVSFFSAALFMKNLSFVLILTMASLSSLPARK